MTGKQSPVALIGLALPTFLLLLPGRGLAQPFQFVTIDVPCGACAGGIARSTSAQGINSAGVIVGNYVDALGARHGFVLSRGRFTTIDVPGSLAGVTGVLPTSASGINAAGDIVGSYTAPVNATAPEGSPEFCPAAGSVACIKGFLYSAGAFSTVLVPGHPGAIPHGITARGDIYGCLHDFDLMASMFGFARTRDGYISLTAGGGELANPSQSVPDSMNNGATPDGGTIVGGWTNLADGHTHGYVVRGGIFQSYDVPGSDLTFIWDINEGRALVGVYHAARNYGFLQLPDGSDPVTLDPPNSVNAAAGGINAGGLIVGQYVDSNGHVHGFLAVPRDSN
jgi:uncharacterized membrane protein